MLAAAVDVASGAATAAAVAVVSLYVCRLRFRAGLGGAPVEPEASFAEGFLSLWLSALWLLLLLLLLVLSLLLLLFSSSDSFRAGAATGCFVSSCSILLQ